MRVATKFAIDAYKAQRISKSALTHEQEERLRHHVDETRRILKQDDSKLSFADVLESMLKPRTPSEQH
jgi:hypothetical protein